MMANPAWKPPLLRKGKEVAELLEAVLWGKEVDLAMDQQPWLAKCPAHTGRWAS